MKKLLKISEASIALGLINKIDKKPLNHILRYWEKEFYQIKPRKINKKRYYSSEQIKLLRKIKYLLKNKGMSISGVKKMLNKKINTLDENNFHGLQAEYHNENFKIKTKKILEKIKKLRNYGKKNTS